MKIFEEMLEKEPSMLISDFLITIKTVLNF